MSMPVSVPIATVRIRLTRSCFVLATLNACLADTYGRRGDQQVLVGAEGSWVHAKLCTELGGCHELSNIGDHIMTMEKNMETIIMDIYGYIGVLQGISV